MKWKWKNMRCQLVHYKKQDLHEKALGMVEEKLVWVDVWVGVASEVVRNLRMDNKSVFRPLVHPDVEAVRTYGDHDLFLQFSASTYHLILLKRKCGFM